MSGFRHFASIFILCSILTLFFACLAADEPSPKMPPNPVAQKLMQKVADAQIGLTPVTIEQLRQMQNGSEPFRLIDVRTRAEFDQGHLQNAEWFSRGTIEFDAMMGKLGDPSEPYILYCKLGHRSILAARMLTDIGYTNVRFLEDGLKGWIGAGHSLYNQHGELKIISFEKKENDK